MQRSRTMSSSESPSPQRERVAEAESAEGLSEEDERGGETQGEGAQSSAAREDSPSRSRSRRSRGRGRHQRAADSDTEDTMGIDVDGLIEEVREWQPLWHMGDRRHADTYVTRRLWEEVCLSVLPRWEDLDPSQQTQECKYELYSYVLNRMKCVITYLIVFLSLQVKGLGSGGGHSEIATRGSSTRRCRPRVAQDAEEGLHTNMGRPCPSYVRVCCKESPSPATGACNNLGPLCGDLSGVRHRGPRR
ncbi:uncharacterized protein [Ranitomeya imitator]|uniref:uncharacterized protein isoform X2 n=1 Tax=Ranitomeya imitator TaxID=111125 RepID=UPI0037E9852C